MDKNKIIPLGPAAEVLGHRLGKLTGKRRMDVILDKDDAKLLVRALPAEDLFFLIKDIGPEDATPLVALASPEQFRGFLDLDCWLPTEGGREISSKCVLRWLSLAREQATTESLANKRAALDLELIEIVLKEGVRIVDRKEVEENGWPKGAPGESPDADWRETPCGSWLVCYEIDGPEGLELRRMVDELYAEDPFGASRFLSAIRSELISELNEHALRFRDGRMEDMGFPPPEVAASLYAKTDISSTPPRQPSPPDEIPGFFLSEFASESFLDRAASSVTGTSARAFLDRSLMYLANTVLVADRIDPGETDSVRDAIGRMRAYLNLGLSYIAGGEVERGAELLRSASLRHVFQVGFTLTLERKWRAERLLDDVAGISDRRLVASFFDPPEQRVLLAALASRPAFALSLDAALAAGWPDTAGALEAAERAPEVQPPLGVRPFAVPEDLRTTDSALGRAEMILALAKAAGLVELEDPEVDELVSEPTFSVRLLTAALNLILGRGFVTKAIDAEAVAGAVHSAKTEDGSLDEDLGSSVLARLTAAEPEYPSAASALMSMCEARFKAAFGALNEEPDPRFLDVVRVVRSVD